MTDIEELYADRPLHRSFYLDTPSCGLVRVTVGVSYRSLRLRLKNGVYSMSAPDGITYRRALESFERLRAQLDSAPAPAAVRTYSLDSFIDYPEGRFAIRRSSTPRAELLELRKAGIPAVLIPDTFDIADPANTQAVTSSIIRLARPRAERILLPRARDIAARLGLSVNGWKIGSGLRTLGTCSSDRIITLSAATLFLTPELRDYIICHELAHLSHMDHSPRFHALCDAYLGGRETALIAALRAHPWPIIR